MNAGLEYKGPKNVSWDRMGFGGCIASEGLLFGEKGSILEGKELHFLIE